MYYVIWLLLLIFCLIPAVVAHVVLKNDEKHNDRNGGAEA
jgi:hypothetical protein